MLVILKHLFTFAAAYRDGGDVHRGIENRAVEGD